MKYPVCGEITRFYLPKILFQININTPSLIQLCLQIMRQLFNTAIPHYNVIVIPIRKGKWDTPTPLCDEHKNTPTPTYKIDVDGVKVYIKRERPISEAIIQISRGEIFSMYKVKIQPEALMSVAELQFIYNPYNDPVKNIPHTPLRFAYVGDHCGHTECPVLCQEYDGVNEVCLIDLCIDGF